MQERLNSLLSEVGESFDYLRSDVRNLGRYLAKLEELIEGYRTFAATVTLPHASDRAALRGLLKRTQKIIGPPPDERKKAPSSKPCREAQKTKAGHDLFP